MPKRFHELDVRLFQAAAEHESPLLDRVLPLLTKSADHGRLWFVVAGLLVARGDRRAAVRGLASLSLASAIANVPAKFMAKRSRPELLSVPHVRQLRRQPLSSSFPSGHSASAAAFTAGVALEAPKLAVPIGLLGAGVAYGRIHTGVHYPGDVAAGLVLGAAGAMAVKRWWPARPNARSTARVAVSALALPDGAGFVLVVNTAGGSADQVDEVEKTLREQLPGAEVVRTEEIEDALRSASKRASVLGVMGGDGSVNCAAGIALEADLPLAVVPGGTLNHFAGELGITSVDEVIEALKTGSATRVSVGSALTGNEGMYFLNTFAIGIYPELVREREKYERTWGKWPAMAIATARVVPRAESVTLEIDGERRQLWTFFAGNGQYHPSGFAPSWRERMDDGCIDVRLIDAERTLARTRLVAALLTGLLGRSRVYEQRVVARLPVVTDSPVEAACDGETRTAPRSMLLRAAAEPLVVYCASARPDHSR